MKKKYKIYGGLRYMIFDGKKHVFKYVGNEKRKTKKHKSKGKRKSRKFSKY